MYIIKFLHSKINSSSLKEFEIKLDEEEINVLKKSPIFGFIHKKKLNKNIYIVDAEKIRHQYCNC